MKKRSIKIALCALSLFLLFGANLMAKEEAATPAEDISVLWVLPFVALLLCIAIIPLINAHFWEKNLWWISTGIFCVPMAVIFTFFMGEQLRHLTLEKTLEYISFITLLASLFIISGGILIKGSLSGTPLVNSIFLLIGSLIASFIGTTGASMLLIRPLIRANKDRAKKAHVIIFFIFLVSNIGGLLTPLGDPPLFLGYLQGIPFEWTFRLIPEWAITCLIVLTVFFIIDTYLYKKESSVAGARYHAAAGKEIINEVRNDINSVINMIDVNNLRSEKKISISLIKEISTILSKTIQKLNEVLGNKTASNFTQTEKFGIDGKINFVLLSGVVIIIYIQGLLIKKVAWWPHFGPQEIGMALLLIISLFLTPARSELRKQNGFTFQPIKEVAFLFAGIFAAMIPALYILEHKGAALGITQPWQFFWATGSLSSFLDNAPTYLTFLSLAKGLHLPNDLGFVLNDGSGLSASVLSAISCGAVFMGANSYIGNGPNFMVKSIAEEQNVKMPSFFGYMVYSIAILIPVFILITFIFFR
jgi:Na+/H+ antiporter NhaD/arsenite permease-like protein